MTVIQAIKVNAGVQAGTATTGTLYTAPATGFAIITLSHGALSGTYVVTSGTRVVLSGTTGIGPQVNANTLIFFVGPSQSFGVTTNSAGITFNIAGIEFINS